VTHLRRLLAAAALALVAATSSAAPETPTSESLQAAVGARRLNDAVRIFGEIAKPSAADEYLAGFALMELHDPAAAEARLCAAKEAAFEVWRGWPTVDALLDRVRVFNELVPPQRTSASRAADPAITVFAGPSTKWSAPVLAAVPEFAEVGHRIFGKDLPPLTLYLFAKRPSYDRFYSALFGVPVPTAWQDGTGTLNVVTYCEVDRDGRTTRPAGEPETVSCVLHEFGHAWFGTWLMAHHGREWLAPSMRRPWLDEGLADYVASLREPAFLERRAEWLRAKAAGGAARPSFDEIADYHAFYEKGDADIHYWTSALLVAELLGDRKRAPDTIRRFLDAAGKSGDPDEAIKTATGREPRMEFDALVRRFW
jgi:hypothetical protein